MKQSMKLDFKNQEFVIGIDVHKENWVVTIRSNRMELKTFSLNPSPLELHKHLNKHYPGGAYKSVYEAGYCGFWIHRELVNLGINNIVINPADVPTTHKEKDRKRDKVDSKKLARELENGSLDPIYVPDIFHQELRSLCRLRFKITQSKVRVMHRVKSYLHYKGVTLPPHNEMGHWSAAFISWLDNLEFENRAGDDYLHLCLEELHGHRERLLCITKELRRISVEHGIDSLLNLFYSVPGIAFVTGITFYTEIMDINRFSNFDKLLSYVGLVPSISSSGNKERDLGLTKRHNRYLKYLMIESAWVAIRKDPVLLHKFNHLTNSMKKQDAIIRIAKKLLSRLRYVWKNQKPYVIGVIE